MTITNVASTGMSGPVDVIHQFKLLNVAKANCPYFEGSMPAFISEHKGSFTAHWTRFQALAVSTTALTALTGTLTNPTRAGTEVKADDVQATIAKFGDFAFLNEEVDLINPNNFAMGFAETFGIQAGRTLCRLQRNELEDNSTVVFEGNGGNINTVNSAISVASIEAAVVAMRTLSAMPFTPMTTGDGDFNTSPINTGFWGICHEHVRPDIEKLAGFVPIQNYAGQVAVAMGEFGYLGTVRWIATPEASADADAGAAIASGVRSTSGTLTDIYSSVIYGRDANGSLGLNTDHVQASYKAGDQLPGVQMITHARGSSGVADPLNEASSIGWKSWHAAKILNEDWTRVILSGASKLQ